MMNIKNIMTIMAPNIFIKFQYRNPISISIWYSFFCTKDKFKKKKVTFNSFSAYETLFMYGSALLFVYGFQLCKNAGTVVN